MRPGNVVRQRHEVTIRVHKQIPLEGGGHRSEFSHTETHVVEVEVDFGALVHMLGGKAVRSVGGKATEASGAVVLRRVKR